MPPQPHTFGRLLAEAIAALSSTGYVSPERVNEWVVKLRNAAEYEFGPMERIDDEVRLRLEAIFKNLTDAGKIADYVPGISRLTIGMVKPGLRAELDRRILAAADLIKLSRKQAIETTLQRFSGWSTSIPPGGSGVIDKRAVRAEIGKSVAQVKYEARRVNIDQGAKLISNIAEIVALDNGAIAGIWHDHGEHDKSYNYRPDHLARSGKLYLVRDSWAITQGLIKRGSAPYTDEIDKPGERVYCFPGDSRIPFADGVEVAYRRWYSGELSEIVMASGKTLRATPNHPVMTPNGWVAIGLLQEGDDVIEIAEQDIKSRKHNQNDAIPTIAQIFDTVRSLGVAQVVGGRREQFHGDGAEGDIDVVSATGPLRFGVVPESGKGGFQFGFASAARRFASRSAFYALIKSCRGVAARGVGRFRTGLVLLGRLVLGDEFVCRLLVAEGPASFDDAASRGAGRNSIPECDLENAVPRLVFGSHDSSVQRDSGRAALGDAAGADPVGAQSVGKGGRLRVTKYLGDFPNTFPFRTQAVKVVNVKRLVFSGHVFNLQTEAGYYIADGILTSNCRCYYVWITSPRRIPAELLTIRGKEWVERGRQAAELRVVA